MYHNTRGIFLSQVKYSDTSVIVKVYTEDFGIQSYMVKGLRGKTSKVRPAMLQPLSLLEMVVTHREKSQLHYIQELRNEYLYRTAREDIRKNAIIFFLNELLSKTLREEQENRELFSFIHDTLVRLDTEGTGIDIFHILFALQLTRHLGFFPEGKYSPSKPVFDLSEGTFVPDPVLEAPQLLRGSACRIFGEMLMLQPGQRTSVKIKSEEKESIFNAVLLYYAMHLPGIPGFKSPEVLHAIFR